MYRFIDTLGEEMFKDWLARYEEIRRELNQLAKGRPSEADLIRIRLYLKPWDAFFRKILFGGD